MKGPVRRSVEQRLAVEELPQADLVQNAYSKSASWQAFASS
jgi:hypothetical protein